MQLRHIDRQLTMLVQQCLKTWYTDQMHSLFGQLLEKVDACDFQLVDVVVHLLGHDQPIHNIVLADAAGTRCDRQILRSGTTKY